MRLQLGMSSIDPLGSSIYSFGLLLPHLLVWAPDNIKKDPWGTKVRSLPMASDSFFFLNLTSFSFYAIMKLHGTFSIPTQLILLELT